MGPVLTYTLSLSGGSVAQFRDIAICKMWNYDSMFIWVSSDSDTYGRVGYDTTAPFDAYDSTNEADWGFQNKRYFFRALIVGQTVGDLPVSGTVNTIQVPNLTALSTAEEVSVPANSEVTIVSVSGAGEMISCLAILGHESALYRVYCDGVMAWSFSPGSMYADGWTASTPGLSLLKYSAGATNNYVWDIRPFQFRRLLEIRVRNPTASGIYCTAYLSAKRAS
jgi:hypothetical protein